ncbi:MAG: 3-oxoacyl-[acyl-carrier-protein] reductase [Firmicutes bacterium]|nr:3-oxoacyl-[acyl-carrier-protein] reductase [Bacillota bacterium]HOB34858.1 3-oxoacyl-[acyl-carrier-protein] reductase [Bacillota bacterium]HPZ90398.1 3-oxoacyl-[acyl-carrier-protein] reductase [Bacillota bacterium]HQE02496.1 3-oxoacyl-[acyl-carrier-protein] reductase [Bacillota bacterium]
MLLSGQVALVTGAGRGIGRAIALALAEAGARVAINYNTSAQAALELAAEIAAAGGEARAWQADVSETDQAAALVDNVLQHFGRLDILVNNAGITRDNLLLRMGEEDWDRVLAVNLKGYFNCCKAAIRPMTRARRGRIINIASVVGLRGNAGQVNYAAAKAGVIGLTKSLAREVGSRNITVNAIAPGFIETDMTRALTRDIREQMLKNIPLGRLGEPADVAGLAVFLAGPGAAYITGQVIAVDGGMAM